MSKLNLTSFGDKLKLHHKIIILFTIGFFVTIIFGFILYYPILNALIKMVKELKPGREMRKYYLKLPIPLDFRVYFFNITNPQEVQEGHKPILKEVGPYCYDAFKEKIVVNENKEEDTLTYTPYDTYFFNKTRTGNLTENDYVTILNPLTVGIINMVAIQKPQFLSTVNKALPVVFKDLYSIYVTVKVKDILFEGVKIDCNVKGFAPTAICSQFKGQPAMKEVGKNIYMFSLLGSRNGSNPTQITVYRGIKDGKTLGNVVAIDNHTDHGIWSDKRCNEFKGTDGWIFPSFLKSDIPLVASDLCRNFQANYIKDETFNGVRVKKYFTVLGNMSEPEENCYCPKPDNCLPKGVIDLTKCLKVPILCTLPHFLEVDEEVLKQVEGLQPETEKHIIKILFEPATGTPVLGARRIQFNLLLQPLQKITILKNVSEVLHPILWIDESIELSGFLLDKIITVSTILKLFSLARYVCLIGSLELIAYGVYLGYKD